MASDNYDEFYTLAEDVCTALIEGTAWHCRSANQCRKIALRGIARWHDMESECDHKSKLCFEKLLQDKLDFAPAPDVSVMENAAKYTIPAFSDFQKHLQVWRERENRFIRILADAVRVSASVDIEIYYFLQKLLDEVQNETMRVKHLINRFELSGWNPHDIGVCSMVIHSYMENDYSGGKLDFNVG